MYICVCNKVTDKQIHKAIDEHYCTTTAELHNILGTCIKCCKCEDAIKEILQQRYQERYEADIIP